MKEKNSICRSLEPASISAPAFLSRPAICAGVLPAARAASFRFQRMVARPGLGSGKARQRGKRGKGGEKLNLQIGRRKNATQGRFFRRPLLKRRLLWLRRARRSRWARGCGFWVEKVVSEAFPKDFAKIAFLGQIWPKFKIRHFLRAISQVFFCCFAQTLVGQRALCPCGFAQQKSLEFAPQTFANSASKQVI